MPGQRIGLRGWTIAAALQLALPSGLLAPGTQSDSAVANAHAFAKLYGYVRFFHPSDEASSIDWDRFAMLGAGRITDARSSEALAQRLTDLFRPVAPTLQVYREGAVPAPAWQPPETTRLKLVAWQHLGVRLDWSKPSVYRSVRLNRPTTVPAEGQGFGNVMQTVDGAALAGRRVRLRALVRLPPGTSGASGHLWLRVDRANNQRGFFDNMNDRPITTAQWQAFEITATVDSEASRRYVVPRRNL
jgi:hypothetical protein